MFGPDGYKLSDAVEMKIESYTGFRSELGGWPNPTCSAGQNALMVYADRYIEFAKRTLPREQSLEGLRVAIDCSNGAAYKVAPEALWELGAEVVAIGIEPDGFNINKDCGSTRAVSPSGESTRSAGRYRHCA